jgi:hypothetical protein
VGEEEAAVLEDFAAPARGDGEDGARVVESGAFDVAPENRLLVPIKV